MRLEDALMELHLLTATVDEGDFMAFVKEGLETFKEYAGEQGNQCEEESDPHNFEVGLTMGYEAAEAEPRGTATVIRVSEGYVGGDIANLGGPEMTYITPLMGLASFRLSETALPKNNDGRSTCCVCGDPTESHGGGQYQMCVNPECDYGKRGL